MLLSRTVRENDFLAVQVQYLKTPYMMRESCKADLARTVSVLPNLRYVDLPDGFYTDSSASGTLRSELQARCPDIRKMKYMEGAEESFAILAQARVWQNLECLELNGLAVEPSTLGYVLSSLTVLHEVMLVDLPTLNNEAMGSLPPIANVTLKETPYVSIEGIANYFSHPGVDETLTSLTLTNTAVLASTLNQILASAPQLTFLSLSEATSRPFPVAPPPPLASKTLRTLHYEISTLNSSQRGATPHFRVLLCLPRLFHPRWRSPIPRTPLRPLYHPTNPPPQPITTTTPALHPVSFKQWQSEATFLRICHSIRHPNHTKRLHQIHFGA